MPPIDGITKMARIVPPNSALGLVLREVLGVSAKVTTWTEVPTSGSAACRYDPVSRRPQSYEVRYQRGNVGNIVHELIHVAVNEAYGLDFINYPNPNPARTPPRRQFDAMGRCTNEEARQGSLMSNGENTAVDAKLRSLSTWASASAELTMERRNEIVAKLSYGLMWPHKEYDTVITQVLVWLHEWGYPIAGAPAHAKPVVNALYEEVEKAVLAAYRRRQAGPCYREPPDAPGPARRARAATV